MPTHASPVLKMALQTVITAGCLKKQHFVADMFAISISIGSKMDAVTVDVVGLSSCCLRSVWRLGLAPVESRTR